MTPEELDRMAKSHFDDMVYPGNMESDAVCDKHNLGLLEHLARAVAVAVKREDANVVLESETSYTAYLELRTQADAIERGDKIC